ncbi:MAG: hypothetical protein BWX96_02627 [Bacteroidetes bacterium ADurb.Bin145]|nr:MAG: hypothetical protein BWX96_02627 [Bacteroidetes bacterium ADurb.Bin145]
MSVIRKIVADTSLDEGLRQRASEISENLEEISATIAEAKFSDANEKRRILSARRMLNGMRVPQTAEILRVLKDRSVEMRRIGLFMVGKFRITSLIPEVCESMTVAGLEEEAVSVLRYLGPEAEDELLKCYFKYSGNVNVSSNILRILGRNSSSKSSSFSFELLWAASRQVKELALELLLDRNYKTSPEERKRLGHLLQDTAGIITDIISANSVFRKNNKGHQVEILNKEYLRWKLFFSGAYSLFKLNEGIADQKTGQNDDITDLEKRIHSIAGIILGGKRTLIDLFSPGRSDVEGKLKKLSHYFPVRPNGYHDLCEKIINYNYNTISVWTKACILRDLSSVRETNIEDSVIALLFGSDEILQEEAARLLERSGSENYGSVMQRIPEKTLHKLERAGSPGFDKEELLFEKTRFLSALFGGIPEDELLTLASRMKYFRDETVRDSGYRCIIWFLSEDGTHTGVIILNDDKVIPNPVNEKNKGMYLLSLESVKEFHRHFPEHVFEIMKYIDENE